MRSLYTGESEVTKGIALLKVGDVVLNLVPKGEQLLKCQRLGIPAVFGCVGLVSPPDIDIPEVTLWSTLFGVYQRDFSTVQDRTFSPLMIEELETETAENYTQRESGGRFEYGQLADLIYPGGAMRIVIDSYFNGIVSGLNHEGEQST